jgi:hypothetical protein
MRVKLEENERDQSPVNLVVRLEILKRGLSPSGMQTAAMLLLSEIARRAESGTDPVSGQSVIESIASAASEYYRLAPCADDYESEDAVQGTVT